MLFFFILARAENRCAGTTPGCECENRCGVTAARDQFEFHMSGAALDMKATGRPLPSTAALSNERVGDFSQWVFSLLDGHGCVCVGGVAQLSGRSSCKKNSSGSEISSGGESCSAVAEARDSWTTPKHEATVCSSKITLQTPGPKRCAAPCPRDKGTLCRPCVEKREIARGR